VRIDRTAGLFPPATTLLSEALRFALRAPTATAFGLLGSAPFAVLLVLFLRESYEAVLVPGGDVRGLLPLAWGLGAVYLWRYPFRLGLARVMAAERGRVDASPVRALGFALRHLPTALHYGSLAALGVAGGAVVVLPFVWCVRAGFALHVFAAGELSSREAYRRAAAAPLSLPGFRLASVASLVFLALWLVLWTAPSYALGLAEWLLKLDVTALRELFAWNSVVWLLVSLAVAWLVVELLWLIALGLLAEEWERLSAGADLAAELDALEHRTEVFA